MFRLLGVSLLATGLAVAQAGAEAPAPFPEFSAKRVKPPKAGVTRRIDIQIEPAPALAAVPDAVATPSGAIAPRAPDSYDWFWEKISPSRAATASTSCAPPWGPMSRPRWCWR